MDFGKKLELIKQNVKELRELGVLEFRVDGVYVSLMPADRSKQEAQEVKELQNLIDENEKTKRGRQSDPLFDSATFGLPEGVEPGFAALRNKRDDDE